MTLSFELNKMYVRSASFDANREWTVHNRTNIMYPPAVYNFMYYEFMLNGVEYDACTPEFIQAVEREVIWQSLQPQSTS